MSERTVTTRKSKVIGTQEYIDKNTGQVVRMEVVSIEDQDFNFMKIFLMNLLNQIDQVGNKKTSCSDKILGTSSESAMPLYSNLTLPGSISSLFMHLS